MSGLLIHGARQVLTLRGAGSPRRGTALRNLSIIEDGSILIEDGKICDVGPTRRIENLALARRAQQISARGRVVMPGFVDSHMRLISAQGQGIADCDPSAAVRDIRQTPAWRLTADANAQLRRCLRYGTTTIDVKSGAGIDEASDLKLLHILAALAKEQPIDLVSTYCGPTAIPQDSSGSPDAYVERLISHMLPLLREKNLANFVALNPAHLNRTHCEAIGDAAARLGLRIKIHSDTPVDSCATNATTVEHLEYVSETGMDDMADSAAIAVLMPSYGFHSQQRGYAPARELIARGVAVALASGYDRSVNPSFSMPITIELACRRLGMAPSEAIVAATLNAAFAVGRGESTGSIEPGKNADILILETPDYRDLAYETGVNPVDITIIRGEVVCQNSVAYGAATIAG